MTSCKGGRVLEKSQNVEFKKVTFMNPNLLAWDLTPFPTMGKLQPPNNFNLKIKAGKSTRENSPKLQGNFRRGIFPLYTSAWLLPYCVREHQMCLVQWPSPQQKTKHVSNSNQDRSTLDCNSPEISLYKDQSFNSHVSSNLDFSCIIAKICLI